MVSSMIARLLITVWVSAAALSAASRIGNEQLIAEFGERGLRSIHAAGIQTAFRFSRDRFSITIDGKRYESASLPEPERRNDERRMAFIYKAGGFVITVGYETRPGWRFIS